MKPKYRAEAFIYPKTINPDESTNEIDDVKIANIKSKLNSPVKSESMREEVPPRRNDQDKLFSFTINEEPIYDEPCSISTSPKLPNGIKYEDIATGLPPRIPIRTSSLVSIDERDETTGSLEEFCFHGYKNGCTASTQRPEEVSEEIFQDNWLRRLEGLRERESSLSVRETLLQERERLLFKKERELRILERLVREKLKQAELHLKLCQSSQSIDSGSFDAKTRFSDDCQRSASQRAKIVEKQTSSAKTMSGLRNDHLETQVEKCERGIFKNPPNSRSSLWTTSTGSSICRPQERTVKSLETLRSSFPNAYSSLRMSKPKIRPRISYDDLDSTLSADIGDSSYVVTSRKFDPAVFKKPQAFVRSSSERRARCDARELPKESNAAEYPPLGFQRFPSEDQVLNRAIDNVIPQDNRIKYQDYGLIDKRISSKATDDAKPSRSSLDKGTDRPLGNFRDRPVSWNEESDEWLRKKRQAYNMATVRMSGEFYENKENAEFKELKKNGKKRESRSKKFGIFR